MDKTEKTDFDKADLCRSCECEACRPYSELYKRMYKDGMYWYTLSPPYCDARPRKHLLTWLQDLKQIKYFATEFILVFEMSEARRLHVHICYSMTQNSDRIKEAKLINRWNREMQHGGPYGGQPRNGGLHYLMKDIEWTSRYTEDATLIYTRDNILSEYKRMKKLPHMNKVKARLDLFDYFGQDKVDGDAE